MPKDLDAAAIIGRIEGVLRERGGVDRGGEVFFTCTRAENHANGDAHPSARWNPTKRMFFCDVCRVGGGVAKLAGELGIEQAQRGKGVAATLTLAAEPR